MKKIKLDLRLEIEGKYFILPHEGWLIDHRYSDKVELAAIKCDFEKYYTNGWNITEVSTGLNITRHFMTRKEAIDWLNYAYDVGHVTPEQILSGIEKAKAEIAERKYYKISDIKEAHNATQD